jgi:hypothetical protein
MWSVAVEYPSIARSKAESLLSEVDKFSPVPKDSSDRNSAMTGKY